jgi:hypothetical protein
MIKLLGEYVLAIPKKRIPPNLQILAKRFIFLKSY